MRGGVQHIIFSLLWLTIFVVQVSPGAAKCSGDSVARERAVDYFYLQALSLVEQEKYDSAFDLLEHCRSLSPSSSAVLFELVNMHQFLGQKEQALDMLKRIVSENPQNYQFWLALLQYFDNELNREAALKVHEEMALAFPGKSDVFISLSARYADLAMFPEAINALNRYETIEGRSEYVSLQKYRMYVIMQQREAALAELASLAKEYPGDLRFRSMEADTYYMFDEKEKALAIYHSILEQDPENITAQLSLSAHYKHENNDTLYLQLTEQLLKNEKYTDGDRVKKISEYINYIEQKDPSGVYTRVTSFLDELLQLPYGVLDVARIYSLYISYNRKGEQEHLPILNKILSIDPEDRPTRLQRLQYAANRSAFNEVVAECDTALMYYPDVLEFYNYRAVACYLQGDKNEAIKTYEAGLEKCSAETSADFISEVYAHLGDVYYEVGNVDAAMQAYETSLSYNSTNIVVLNNYAYYLALANRDLERALEMSYHTIKASPDEAIYIDTYAWILFLLERYDEAKEYADKLMSAEGEKSAVEFHHCGDIYFKNGDVEKALECWIKAREMGDDSKVLNKKIKKKKYIPNGKNK